jgi:hypothetical protein
MGTSWKLTREFNGIRIGTSELYPHFVVMGGCDGINMLSAKSIHMRVDSGRPTKKTHGYFF